MTFPKSNPAAGAVQAKTSQNWNLFGQGFQSMMGAFGLAPNGAFNPWANPIGLGLTIGGMIMTAVAKDEEAKIAGAALTAAGTLGTGIIGGLQNIEKGKPQTAKAEEKKENPSKEGPKPNESENT